MHPSSGIFGFMNILMTTKTLFKIRQSKIALKQTLTLKLGEILVLTVTQVYVFVNLCRKTSRHLKMTVILDTYLAGRIW